MKIVAVIFILNSPIREDKITRIFLLEIIIQRGFSLKIEYLLSGDLKTKTHIRYN